MPEFIIEILYRGGATGHRLADDARHAKRILSGLNGRYGARVLLSVHRVGSTEDVTADFVLDHS
jgi:hypothetical protein